MKVTTGKVYEGPAGSATEVLVEGPYDVPDWAATVAAWFLDCPGQSAAWSHYQLTVIHLRPIDGVRPAVIRIPHATHEMVVYALDPALRPRPEDPQTWRPLIPLNVEEQIQLPDDQAARRLADRAAWAVVQGVLPAEPPLAGAVEPWRSSLLKTSAHLRGEVHAP